MDETRGREALTAELRHAIEAIKQKAEENSDPKTIASYALEALDRNDPSLDVHCHVMNCIVLCRGRLDVLKIARDLGYPWNIYTSYFAARKRIVEVMAYLHENGCPWDAWTCLYAAARGHLELLKYLFDHGCPRDEFACAYAADRGHLECLKFLHEHGCPWDGETIRLARHAGNYSCLEYAQAHGCPEDIIDDDNDDDDDDNDDDDDDEEEEEEEEDQRELAKRISDKLPTVMAVIAEHSAALPERAYVELCGFSHKVQSFFRKRKR